MTKEQMQNLLKEETKYSKWYLNIIFKAKLENRKKLKKDNIEYVYYENHHILPKSIFIEYKDLKINKWNGVLLTYREHILIHILIYKHYKKLDSKFEEIKMGHTLVKIVGTKKLPVSYYIRNKSRQVQSELMSKSSNIFKTKNPSHDSSYQCEFCGIHTTKSAYIRWHSFNCLQNPNLILENRGKNIKLFSEVNFYCKYCSKKLNKSNHNKHNDNCLLNPLHPNKGLIIKNNKIVKIKCEHCDEYYIPNVYYQSHHNNCAENINSETYKRRKIKKLKHIEQSAKKAEYWKGSFALLDLNTGKTFKSNNTFKDNPMIIAKSTKKLFVLIYPDGKRVIFMSRNSIYNYKYISPVINSFIINQANKGKFTPYNKMKNNPDYILLTGFESESIMVSDFKTYISKYPNHILVKSC